MSTAGPVHRVQSAVEVYGYPQGHLGHLTAEEQNAFNDFKSLLTEKGLYKSPSDTDEYGTHDDATLLRFLRARRFQVQDAFKQFKDTEDWRKATQLDKLYETIDVEQYDETRKLYPQWTGRRDRRGIPVYVYEVRHLNSKTMAEYEKSAAHTHSKAKGDGQTPAKLLRLFALYENLIRFVMPLCTTLTDREYPETPITQSNNIVDISGVGLKQFWNLRTHMQDASTLATAHYPETLDRIFIIGAPAFFPTVWGWIKRWFDPITTSKIFILSQHDMQSTLRKFIDPANIPKKFGGELDFEFGGMPALDPALKDLIMWKGSHTDFPHGPMFWHDRGDYIELEAVGSVNKQERRETVCKLRKPAPDHVYSEKQNGEALTGATPRRTELRPDLLRAATEKEDLPTTTTTTTTTTAAVGMADGKGDAVAVPAPEATPAEPGVAVEAGELVPASRPEPVSFVTAVDNLNTLSVKDNDEKLAQEKTEMNGMPPESQNAVTAGAPAAKAQGNGVPKEGTPQHEETLTKIATGKHSIESKGSLESGRKSNRSGGLKKRILGKLKG